MVPVYSLFEQKNNNNDIVIHGNAYIVTTYEMQLY